MKLHKGYLFGAHCPLCGDYPIPRMGWYCEGCGSDNVRMKFLISSSMIELRDIFGSFLKRLGHSIQPSDWVSNNYDYLNQPNPSQYADALNFDCKFPGCGMMFDITSVEVGGSQDRMVLWGNNVCGIAVGYCTPGDVRATMNRNHRGDVLSSNHPFVCRKLHVLK